MSLTNAERRERRNALLKQLQDEAGSGTDVALRNSPDAERERELFVTAIRPLLDGLIVEGKKNMATMSPGTVAHLAAQLEEVLVGWDFATFGRRARRCRLCGEKIVRGKLVMRPQGPTYWACHQKDVT